MRECVWNGAGPLIRDNALSGRGSTAGSLSIMNWKERERVRSGEDKFRRL